MLAWHFEEWSSNVGLNSAPCCSSLPLSVTWMLPKGVQPKQSAGLGGAWDQVGQSRAGLQGKGTAGLQRPWGESWGYTGRCILTDLSMGHKTLRQCSGRISMLCCRLWISPHSQEWNSQHHGVHHIIKVHHMFLCLYFPLFPCLLFLLRSRVLWFFFFFKKKGLNC